MHWEDRKYFQLPRAGLASHPFNFRSFAIWKGQGLIDMLLFRQEDLNPLLILFLFVL